MKCKQCQDLGQKSFVYEHGGTTTLMYNEAFYDEDGVRHFHDMNTTTSHFSCSKGHKWTEVIPPRCPAIGCGWGE